MRKRVTIFLLALLMTAGGGVFYYLKGLDHRLRFSQQQLQQKLAAKLPLTKTYLAIFEVTLERPRVLLREGSSRINAGLDVILNIRLGNQTQPLGGFVDASGGLRYAPESGELFLTDPAIEGISLQGVPVKYAEKLHGVLARVLTDYYAVHPIYRFSAADPKQAAARWMLKQVVVENGELVVALGL
jgi:hypothetical protein